MKTNKTKQPKYTARVKSIIALSDLIEDSEPYGVIYNSNQAHMMFKNRETGALMTATIMSKGNVKIEAVEKLN